MPTRKNPPTEKSEVPARSDGRPRPGPGDQIVLTLESLGHGGEAVGRADGFVHFVPEGAPGDEVRVEVLEVKRSFARSVIREILTPSPARVEPPCPYFGLCGGCHLQHLSVGTQLESRQRTLRDVLQRIGKIENPEVGETVGGESAWGYRHRVTLHALTRPGGSVHLGFVDTTGDRLVAIESCAIAHPVFTPILSSLAQASNEVTEADGDILLRTGHPASDVQVHLGTGTEAFTSPLLRQLQNAGATDQTTIFWNEGSITKSAPRAKPTPLRFVTPWATWVLPYGVFYQVNPGLAVRLAELVREWAEPTPEDRVLDLYGGFGFFAAALATSVKRVWCLESEPRAIRSGEIAARKAGLDVRFVPGPVEELLPTMNVKGQLTLAILDPPREGVAQRVIDSLIEFRPARIIYVSCEPATLARDIQRLAPRYRHVRSVPFDFFPQTYHFESVTLLERTGA